MCGFILAPKAFDIAHLIAHRGEAGRIKCVETAAGELVHARLPIVGLGPEFDQPFRAGTHTVAWVGEILDFKDYGSFSCDTELVREMMTRMSSHFFPHDGFWSICSVSDKGEVDLVCDYLAQKPTYYRTDVVAASSELEPLVRVAPVLPDNLYLSACCKWGYCPNVQRTPYEEIKRVLPGERVTLAKGLTPPLRHRVDPLVPVSMPPAILRKEIEKAVERRVTSSDVPVAILLSGGLDSSIVYLCAKAQGADLRAYFVRGMSDDSVEPVARMTGGKLTVVEPSVLKVEKQIEWMQEPIDLGSLRAQCLLSEAVEERVCLTGDGADEFFGGYPRASRYDSQFSDVWHELVAWHLPRLDRIMMRNLVEVRSPFLARTVAQIALALPHELRRDKLILRDLFCKDLPPEIIFGKKIPLKVERAPDEESIYRVELVRKFREARWPSQ